MYCPSSATLNDSIVSLVVEAGSVRGFPFLYHCTMKRELPTTMQSRVIVEFRTVNVERSSTVNVERSSTVAVHSVCMNRLTSLFVFVVEMVKYWQYGKLIWK